MKQRHYFYKTLREAHKDESSLNAQLLLRAGYIDKLMAGVYTMLPLGIRVLKKIEKIIREEINAIGGQELMMPSMHPKENWEKTGRWESYDALIKFGLSDEKNMLLGPTHEEVVSPLAKRIINSYRDLPQYVYQFQNKFRNEKRAKSGLLRGREFIMKDLYSFHVDQEDLDQYYEKTKIAYENIFKRTGIWEKTYLTYASGGTFSRYSHEYQTLTDSGEDIIYICSHCRIAINREIIEDLGRRCPVCGSDALEETKAIEVGNIFKLGTKYSEPFGLTYTDKEGNSHPVIMGCYGIGLQRLMGTIVEVRSDEKGIVWPEEVAPFKVHLISIGQDADVITASEKLYEKLVMSGEEVLWDDRQETTVGAKFSESDLIGIPWRAVVSPKTIRQGKIEIKRRNEPSISLATEVELINSLKKQS